MGHRGSWLILGCVLCAVLISCRAPTPAHYLLRSGFTGWVRVDFKVADAAPLIKDSGAYIVRVDSRGHASTSSNPIDVLAQHRFFIGEDQTGAELTESFWNAKTEFKESTGQREPRIWGRGIIIDENERVYERFFVGTRQQFADSIRDWPAPLSQPVFPKSK